MRYKFSTYCRDNGIDPASLRGGRARSAVWRAWFREASQRWQVERLALVSRRVAKANGVADSFHAKLALLPVGSPEAAQIIALNKSNIPSDHVFPKH